MEVAKGKCGLMPKVRIFIWRCIHDALPLMFRRGVGADGLCPWCGMVDEDLNIVIKHKISGRVLNVVIEQQFNKILGFG